MKTFRKFVLVVFIFGAVTLNVCGEAIGYYATNYYDNDIVHTLPSPTPVAAPAPTTTPLPSLAESIVPIVNTFAATHDGFYVIKEDGGLWHISRDDELTHILDNTVSLWLGWGYYGGYVHRTDGSLWRWELGSDPCLFLEDVAYFDGRLHVIKSDGSLWACAY